MQNLVEGKNAVASGYIAPFTASKALIYSGPLDRWVCNTVPCTLTVDLQDTYYISHWVVVGMANFYGWNLNTDYILSSYQLQGSHDSLNWFNIDQVSNNSSASTSRALPTPVQARYVRIYVNQGLRGNPQVASIVELQVYGDKPTSALLSDLESSSGVLDPAFSSTQTSYTVAVDSGTTAIAFMPTAEDPNAKITVDGVDVPSGYYSHAISLPETSVTDVSIVVTPEIGDPVTYSVAVTRSSNAYLDGIRFVPPISLSPAFNQTTFNYTASTDKPSVRIIPTAVDTSATIKVNGTVVASADSIVVSLSTGSNTVTIEVIPSYGTAGHTYTLNITKTS